MDIRIDSENNRIKRNAPIDPARSAWNNSAENYNKTEKSELAFDGLKTAKKKPQQQKKLQETVIRKEPPRKTEPVRQQESDRRASNAAQSRTEQPEKQRELTRISSKRELPRQPEPAPEVIMDPEEEREYAEELNRRRRIMRRVSVIAAIVFVIGIMGFLVYRFMRAENIKVIGNADLNAEYITELSGLQAGEHIFTIDLDLLEKNFTRDARVEFLDMNYVFPNTVELNVKEHMPIARFVLQDGTQLMIDGECRAVAQKDQEAREYILIEGLAVSDYSIGYPVRTEDTYKQSILGELLTKLYAAGFKDKIERIDIDVITNIKLFDHAGMEIRFGTSENIDLKIKWMTAVMKRLNDQGISEGVLDVYSEDKAIYSKPVDETLEGGVSLNYIDIHYDDLIEDRIDPQDGENDTEQVNE